MENSDSCCPKNIDECNIATDALMSEIAKRLQFDSKFLVNGQENALTQDEYEALFLEDMKICEDALDIVLDLARKQKAYLETLVAAKQMEIDRPEAIADALTQISQQKNNFIELQEKVQRGDFFVSTAVQDSLSSNSDDIVSTAAEAHSSIISTEEGVNSKSKSGIDEREMKDGI